MAWSAARSCSSLCSSFKCIWCILRWLVCMHLPCHLDFEAVSMHLRVEGKHRLLQC